MDVIQASKRKPDPINGYNLSRDWFDFCFENPELINPNHSAMYFFIIEHCNRLGWKEKFGLPMEMTKEAIGIKNYKTFSKTFNDLIAWGFIKLIQKSVNQYSANIIALVKNTKASTKALTNATLKQSKKQVRGIVCIDKPSNHEPNNLITGFPNMPLPKDCGELPQLTAESARELVKLTKGHELGLSQVYALWPVFLNQNITGKKYYADIADVYSHFINWTKTQRFEDLKLTTTTKAPDDSAAKKLVGIS